MNKNVFDKMKNLLRQILPQPVKSLIKIAHILTLRGSRFYCPVCQRGFRKFFEFGVNPRPNACCPGRGSLERHRLLWVALCDLQGKGLIQRGGGLLHVAPEPCLAEKFRQEYDYLSIDIDSKKAMMSMDITTMTFEDEFGVIVCNHVLEHIPDDKKTIKRCPGITLTLVGKDPEGIRDDLHKTIHENELDEYVEIIDGIGFTELHLFLQQFHVFIHPSKYGNNRDSEGGAPVVLLDAQVTGMPILSTTHCDMPDEVIDGKTGVLVKESDVERLADAIEAFYLMDEPSYHLYCRQARKHVEDNYDAVKNGQILQEVYFDVAKNKSVRIK